MKRKSILILIILLFITLSTFAFLALHSHSITVNTILHGNIGYPLGPELALNGGFETLGAGPPFDIFADWTSIEGAGTAVQTLVPGEVHSGTAALKLTTGVAAPNTELYDAFIVSPGAHYQYEFWVMTEAVGGTEGRYLIYDWTNFAWIVLTTGTGVSPSVYTRIYGTFTAPPGCILAGFYCLCSLTIGDIVWFDDVSVRQILN